MWPPWPSFTTGCSTVRGFTSATTTTSSASPCTRSKTTWPLHRYARPIRGRHVTVTLTESVSDWLSVCSGGQRPGRPHLGHPDSEVSVAAEGTPQQRSVCPGVHRYTRCKVHHVQLLPEQQFVIPETPYLIFKSQFCIPESRPVKHNSSGKL